MRPGHVARTLPPSSTVGVFRGCRFAYGFPARALIRPRSRFHRREPVLGACGFVRKAIGWIVARIARPGREGSSAIASFRPLVRPPWFRTVWLVPFPFTRHAGCGMVSPREPPSSRNGVSGGATRAVRFVAATVLVSGRFVYSKNPLYVVSALLVLWGLWISFDTSAPWFTSGALMIGLAVYTLLLAGTAVLLIRAGRVWEDVRTLLLLVVLMLLAISVSFDAFPVTSAVADASTRSSALSSPRR